MEEEAGPSHPWEEQVEERQGEEEVEEEEEAAGLPEEPARTGLKEGLALLEAGTERERGTSAPPLHNIRTTGKPSDADGAFPRQPARGVECGVNPEAAAEA